MKKKLNSYNIFIIIGAISVLASLNSLIVIPDKLMSLSAMDSFQNVFNDFEIHVNFATDLSRVYDKSIHACFPPLIYIFYHIIAGFMPSVEYMRGLYVYIFIGAIFLIVNFILFAIVCKRYMYKENDFISIFVIALLSLSSCFVFGVIQCANVSFTVLILLMLAAEFREADNKLKQELALIFIAVAAAIKVYPAIFGILYLIEKKYSQAIRLVIYGILFFAVPFAFTGGLSGLEKFIFNLAKVQETWGQASPNGIYSNLVSFGVSELVAKASVYVFALLSLAVIVFVKDNWKRLYIICFIMVMCPLWSGAYTSAFFVLPFLYMIKDKHSLKGLYDYLYTILFSLMFTASCISFKISSYKIFLLAIMIYAIIIVEEISVTLKNKKSLT